MHRKIPNILTISRLMAVLILPLPFLLLSHESAPMAAFLIFVYAAITDFFDGYLARRWEVVSELGRMLDPIADKALIIMALMILLATQGLNFRLVIPASIILFREILVAGMREFLGDRAKGLAVTNLAKWKTSAQLSSTGLILFAYAIDSSALMIFGIALLWIAAVLTAITGFDYARKSLALLEG